MKPKAILTVVLLGFVGVSVGYMIYQEARSGTKAGSGSATSREAGSPESPAAPGSPAAGGDKVVAYYFHRDVRCATCRKIEAYSKELILGGYASELERGRLEFHTINTDDPEHEHFIQDYDLAAGALVLADFRGGKQTRWKNLEDVWVLYDEKDAFLAYVKQELEDYLGRN